MTAYRLTDDTATEQHPLSLSGIFSLYRDSHSQEFILSGTIERFREKIKDCKFVEELCRTPSKTISCLEELRHNAMIDSALTQQFIAEFLSIDDPLVIWHLTVTSKPRERMANADRVIDLIRNMDEPNKIQVLTSPRGLISLLYSQPPKVINSLYESLSEDGKVIVHDFVRAHKSFDIIDAKGFKPVVNMTP